MIRFPFRQDKNKQEPPASSKIIDQPKHERDQFEEVLRSYKATRIDERLEILDAFLSTEQHVTLGDLQELIRQKNGKEVDRLFLLDTMEMFCQFGFAQQQTFDAQDTTYEHHHLGTHHDHFICTRCGLIQEFSNLALEKLQLQIAAEFEFHPLQHKMEIYGLCSRCMMKREPTLPILMAANGEKVEIVQLLGGKEMQSRLASMGLTVGTCVEIINNHASGPFIIAINESRLALGMGMAQQILVRHSCRHV